MYHRLLPAIAESVLHGDWCNRVRMCTVVVVAYTTPVLF